eukprot:CAMPEP_0195286040 /NCGR_PEP_ID=MMETSP0707-20130614/3651_1 /TAXON_ID=33640 /ORGANISM="Asterionellopsis glacialis, Strain CCMP134" /LENGTH=386 /DNA_ID=CAMNT_0040345631 /DNA_START=81 /DNA_END=1241 /DNA_ORIENTATION=-
MTHPVDLLLPKDKEPTKLKDVPCYSSPRTVKDVFKTTYAIGSSLPDEKVYCHDQKLDLGLFECIYEAWKNHYNLRTSPEDWWFAVASRIAKAINKIAKEGNNKVRNLFVDHEGKDTIGVKAYVFSIYDVDYDSFFSEMSLKITSRIKVPQYAEAMQNDFSTSTMAHRIASQINFMVSMQEFFDYEMLVCGCGIKGLEMLGKQSDWDKLSTKLKLVKKQLEPIQDDLHRDLGEDWWGHVEHVFNKLAETYAAHKDSKQMSEVADFWADIFMVGKGWKYGPSGFGGYAAEEYNGWLVKFLTGSESILTEKFFSGTYLELLKGFNSVPMKITLTYLNHPVSDDSELTAGIMGFNIHEKDTFNGIPSLQPHHMWALKIPPSSPLRKKNPE